VQNDLQAVWPATIKYQMSSHQQTCFMAFIQDNPDKPVTGFLLTPLASSNWRSSMLHGVYLFTAQRQMLLLQLQ